MKKRIASLVLAVLLVVGALPVSAAFVDVADTDLAAKIDLLQTFGIVSGYEDGTFRPQNSLTRAEYSALTVRLLGAEGGTAAYGSYTIFGDVRGGFWAAGYINYLARELKLISGYGDGSFRPANKITLAEAATILLRALGYSDADVGMRWPDGHMEKALALGLLDGTSGVADRSLTRAEGAMLFYNALYAKPYEGKRLIDDLVGDPIKNALVLSVDAIATDGTPGAVKLDGEETATKSAIELDDSLVGRRADFTTGKEGTIIGVTLLEQTRVTIAVNYCDSEKITALDGETYKIAESVRMFRAEDGLDGTSTSYSKVRASLSVGDGLELAYRADGELDYVLLLGGGSALDAKVVGINATASTIFSAVGAPSTTPIYKNGARIAANDLAQYDVATYNRAAGIINVCSFKLQGVYEFAFPNAAAPSRVTVNGNVFGLTPAAAASMDGIKIGERLTLLFTSGGEVVRAISGAVGSNPAGLYTGSTVEFIGGPTLNFSFDNVTAGELVVVNSNGTASRLNGRNVSASLNLTSGKLGDGVIAPDCVFFERVGSRGIMAAVERGDILVDLVPSSNIGFVVYDAAGRANIIVFDNLTGDQYIYGELTGRTEYADEDAFDVDKYYVAVSGATGRQEFRYPRSTMPKNGWGGIAVDRDDVITETIELTRYVGMTRQDFVGSDALMVEGIEVPIPNNVQVYLAATKTYMDADDYDDPREMVADARAFGSEFEVYMENVPGVGKVRILIVK